jgi:hypothetical protein
LPAHSKTLRVTPSAFIFLPATFRPSFRFLGVCASRPTAFNQLPFNDLIVAYFAVPSLNPFFSFLEYFRFPLSRFSLFFV